jgi:hypothetical protein
MGGAVVLENQRVIHGDNRGTLLKAASRIAPCRHRIAQELVSFCHCTSGAGDEACQHLAPSLHEPSSIGHTK